MVGDHEVTDEESIWTHDEEDEDNEIKIEEVNETTQETKQEVVKVS